MLPASPDPAPAPASSPVVAIEPEPRRPASLTELFLSFNRLALQGFGGVLPVAQRELVERERWLTNEKFVELLAVAQVLPGPNVVNLSLMIGDQFFGFRGAFVALAGMLASPLLIVLALAALYGEFAMHPAVSGALHGMGAVAAGLILSTGIKLMSSLKTNVLGQRTGLLLAAVTFAVIGLWRVPLLWLLAILGPIGVAMAWRKLR
ncbi:MAG: chromate transporter [Rhizobacter sp.]|nr:chromate transporter [Rhizobacter sp.]